MLSLTPQQELILQTVVLQADASVTDIARQTGLQAHKVRHAVEKFFEAGIFLGIRPFINFTALGLTNVHLFISALSLGRKDREKLLQLLCQHEAVWYVGETGSDPQFEVQLYARSPAGITTFEEVIARQFPRLSAFRSMSVMYRGEYSGPTYESARPKSVRPLIWGPVARVVDLDAIDHKLLSVLSSDSFTSKNALAKQMGLPSSTVFSRLDRLERNGVIAGYYYLCDFKKWGHQPNVIMLSTTLTTEKDRNKILKYCRANPRVAFADLMCGSWQARIFTIVKNHEEALEIVTDIKEEFQNTLCNLYVVPQLEFHKCDMYPFKSLPAF